MANQLKKIRTITDKVSVNGTLSEDGNVITYLNEDKNEEDISVKDCLKAFFGKDISFSVSVKTEDEIPDFDEE
jgi:hypothetical protein